MSDNDNCTPYLRGCAALTNSMLSPEYLERALEALHARGDRIWNARMMPRRMPPSPLSTRLRGR
jgi:hypothetical protein